MLLAFFSAYIQVIPVEMKSEDEQSKTEEEFTPREYQVEIINRAIEENVIIFLPTGSGKTFIAIKIIEHFSSQLLQGKKTFFLVNTVTLVTQQSDHIKLCLPFTVGGYSGDLGVDYWNDATWKEEIDKTQILVMTAQIYLELIMLKRISVSDCNVIIFDECHQAVNKHPMRQIMMELKSYTGEKPRVVGLTATLLNSNQDSVSKVHKVLSELEETFDATIIKATNREMVLQFSTNPCEKLEIYSEEQFVPGLDLIKETVDDLSSFLNMVTFPDDLSMVGLESPDIEAFLLESKSASKKLINSLSDIQHACLNLGTYCASKCTLHKIIMFEKMKLLTNDYVLKVMTSMTTKLHCLRKSLLTLSNFNPLGYCSDKVIKLLGLLKNFPPDHVAIVFVERRSTAQVLSFFLKDVVKDNPDYEFVRPDFVVGHNASGKESLSREGMLARKVNNTVLKRFRKKEVNVLFASSVIEEGIDIRVCNLVIKFDTPLTFRSYIQSKGRARHKDSTFIIFATPSFYKLYNQFKLTEEILNSRLLEGIGLESPYDDQDDENFYYQINGPNGPKITSLNAVSLINRYCSMLPQDSFSRLTVQWWLKKSSAGVTAFLKLPVNSPVKDFIEGPPRRNRKSAMRLAALKACELLHLHGELNNNLLPYGKNDEVMLDPDWFPRWVEDENAANKVGSKQLKRTYKQSCPKWLMSSSPRPNVQAYVHVIVIKPVFSSPATSRLQAFYDLLESSRTFAVITSSPLPKICRFPLYMNVGELSVDVLMNACNVTLTEEEIDSLRCFHSLLFTDVLPLVKEFMIQADEDSEDSFLIAPVIYDNGKVELDWTVVYSEKEFPEICPVPLNERLTTPVTPELYLHNLVVPWYRAKDETSRYIVTRVRQDLNPESEFPESNFPSFTSYFKEKYNQDVSDLKQPLIEVRAISSKINCLRPRSKRKPKKDENFEETFIPELCHLITFPAVYALKCSLLPSLMHRFTRMLSAEELRQMIATETGLGFIDLDKKKSWKPLMLDIMSADPEEDEVKNPDEIINFRAQTFENKEIELIDITRELDVDLASIIYYHNYITQRSALLKPKSPGSESDECFCTEVAPDIQVLKKSINKTCGPELREVFTALTSSSSDDIVNYERLETLGDSFLKFAASLALFVKFKNKDEGKLTRIKGKAIANANLFFCGRNLLGPRLKVDPFAPSEWKIPGFTVPQFLVEPLLAGEIGTSILADIVISPEERVKRQLKDTTITKIMKLIEKEKSSDKIDFSGISSNKDAFINKQVVADKVIADAVEALLGVYLREFGIRGGLKMLGWLGVMPPEMCQPQFLLDSPTESPCLQNQSPENHLIQPGRLENIIGYSFKDGGFLLQAMSHPSAGHCVTDCYQRLEFLGDAIIDFLITAYIYENCSNLPPGKLTDLRSALVNNNTFACLTVRYGLHKHINSMGYALDSAVYKFVQHQEANKHKLDSNVLHLISENDIHVAGTIDVPKVLGDIFESLVGAVYLDSGKDLNVCWKMIYRLMGKEIKKFSEDIPINSIRKLYETFPSVQSTFGNAEHRDGKCIITLEIITDKQHVFAGMGFSKYEAKMAAAKLALQSLCDK